MVAIAGLAVNLVSFRLLHAGVIVSVIVILATGWPHTDAVVALALAAFIVPRAVSLGKEALRIVVQAAPASVDVEAMTLESSALPSVRDVHDVHVWALTSGMDVASVHLVSAEAHTAEVVRAAQRVLRGRGLAHATVQVEDDSGERCGAEW